MKWSNFTPHEKNSKIKMAIFIIGLAVILVYTMGFNEFTSIIGTLSLIAGALYLINKVVSWFKKP